MSFHPVNRFAILAFRHKPVIESIGRSLGITSKDEYERWYNVDKNDFIRLGGRSLLRHSRNSLPLLISHTFPEHKWDLSKFKSTSREDRLKLEREVMYKIGKKLGIKENDFNAWYKVPRSTFVSEGGGSILRRSRLSYPEFFVRVFPEHNWNPSKFPIEDNLPDFRSLIDKIGVKLGINQGDYDAWYKVKLKDFEMAGGSPLLNAFGKSVSKVVAAVFPEHEWEDSKFRVRPKTYWISKENQRRFLEELGQQFNIGPTEFEKWYQISRADIIKGGGSRLLTIYGDSPYSLFSAVFPEYTWLPWKFPHHVTEWMWSDNAALQKCVNAVEEALQIKDLDSWYRVTKSQIQELDLDGFIKSAAHLCRLLNAVYPEREWERDLLLTSESKSE